MRDLHDRMRRGCRTIDGMTIPFGSAPDAVEVRHLRSFVAVAQELSFARAAATLYLSAPALSRQIRTLERLVGCDLFRRNTHSELIINQSMKQGRTLPCGFCFAIWYAKIVSDFQIQRGYCEYQRLETYHIQRNM